ncbi:hypothetical protein MED222_18533 [Vibrio sp. MED222]|nr:hypothetical protein MED222_18533 [Vibrio sp. MED222]
MKIKGKSLPCYMEGEIYGGDIRQDVEAVEVPAFKIEDY